MASGGELSRIGLAIFTLTSRNTSVPTLIFDEVDSGVGGATGEVVGQMMKQLGLTRQVLCVTHLPQVAACGDHHLKVEKVSDGIETVSYLRELNPTQRVEEIARMLGGLLITQKTKVLAEEMVRANSGGNCICNGVSEGTSGNQARKNPYRLQSGRRNWWKSLKIKSKKLALLIFS